MTNLPTKTISGASMMLDLNSFEQMYRVGKVLASSVLFPEHLRKGTPEQAAANGMLVYNMALRLNEDPLTVAQNIYFVGGKPGWSSSYMIGKANQHGVFEGGISWDIKGKGDDLSVTAFAKLKDTGERVQATCDMAMARAEGWTKNAKYKSMPEQMLRYRSATFLIRLYCPEVMVGVPAQVEVELGGNEMRDVTPREYNPAPAEDRAETKEPDDAELVEEDEKPKPAREDDKAAREAAAKAKAEDNAKREDLQRQRDKQTAKDETPHDPETGEVKEEQEQKRAANRPDPAEFRGLLDLITRDLTDGASVDEVLDLYEGPIGSMKTAAPEVYDDLQAELAEYRKAEAAA